MYRKSATITVAALSAAAEETYTITDAKAHVDDVICVNPPTNAEAGWGIIKAWVDSEGTIKVTASNFGSGSLTGGDIIVRYANIR